MDTHKTIVYVKTDEQGRILDINSSSFLDDTEGWTAIDEGEGDKYMHAYLHYLPGRPCAEDGVSLWKLVDGVPTQRSEEEIAADRLPDLDALRAAKQDANKAALADWLAAHPLTWTDGNVYGVTEQDQTEMAINLAQYQLAAAAGQPAALEWHAQKQQCHTFTIEEYTELSLAIAAYVYPYRRYQEQVKAAIYAAESEAEIGAIEIDYGSVSAAA